MTENAPAAFRNVIINRIFEDIECSRSNLEICTDIEKDLGLQYVWNKETSSAYIPLLHTENLNLQLLDEIQTQLLKSRPCCNVVLAIADSNSTILYYNVKSGIMEKV